MALYRKPLPESGSGFFATTPRCGKCPHAPAIRPPVGAHPLMRPQYAAPPGAHSHMRLYKPRSRHCEARRAVAIRTLSCRIRPHNTCGLSCLRRAPFLSRQERGERNGRGKIPISSPGPLFETAQGEVPLRIPTRLCQSINHALHSRLSANAVSPSKAPGGVPPCSVSNDRPDKAGGSASRWPDPASGQSP